MRPDFIYKCTDCEEVFEKKFDLLQHENIHLKKTPFMCLTCKRSFSLVKQYVDHINCRRIEQRSNSNNHKFKIDSDLNSLNDSEKSDEVFCKNSSEVLDNSHNFNDHLSFKINGSDFNGTQNLSTCDCCACLSNYNQIKSIFKKDFKNFECGNCNKRFSTNMKLLGHACFVSASEKTFKCSCLKIFTKVSNFKAHVGGKPYGCCSCSMQFNTITNLIRHIRTHTKQKPYVCKDCGRGFSQSANLRNHLSTHLGVRAINCDECDFSCKTLNGLIKHKKKHNEGVNHPNYVDGRKKSTNKSICPICNKQFMFKRNMGMHMKIHINKVSLCTECGKVFNSKSKLTSHYKACHREPSVCKTCGKVFASAVLLNAHEKIHVSDKLFSCDFCQKAFSVKNYLVQHMKTHSNKKQFSCCKCGKLFKVAVSLKYHSNICSSLNIPI